MNGFLPVSVTLSIQSKNNIHLTTVAGGEGCIGGKNTVENVIFPSENVSVFKRNRF
jgi:hypothetical protein